MHQLKQRDKWYSWFNYYYNGIFEQIWWGVYDLTKYNNLYQL